jgi:cell division protein FtsQ
MRRLRLAASSRRPAARRLRASRVAPLLACAALVAVLALGLSPLGQPYLQRAVDTALRGTAVIGLAVADIEVEGRETTDRDTILEALGAGIGTPILAVSPNRAKEQLEKLPWVRSAVIERRLPDTIYVRLVERKPLALWQHGGKIELVDRDGDVIAVTRLDEFARLQMVVGEDAAGHAKELVDMLAKEPDLAARVGAAVWVGGRRWNLRVDNAIDVLLPAEDAAAAWAELARLDRSEQLLERDVEAVDLRLPDRIVLRVGPDAAPKAAPSAKKGRPTAKNT